jgi:hypothetical protein
MNSDYPEAFDDEGNGPTAWVRADVAKSTNSSHPELGALTYYWIDVVGDPELLKETLSHPHAYGVTLVNIQQVEGPQGQEEWYDERPTGVEYYRIDG